MTGRRSILMVLIALFILVSTLIFYPDYDSPRMIKFLIVTQIMFALSVGIYFAGRTLDFENRDRKLFYLVIGLALVARVVMLVGAGDKYFLSDDIYRYVWDGKVASHDINPYLYSPLDPEVSHLRDSTIHPLINHPELPTIYPPTAQSFFRAAYALGAGSTLHFKLIFALFELLTIGALLVWLKRSGTDRSAILIYLFSPLILVEFYLSSHLDILGLPFLIVAFLTVKDHRPVITGLMLALATTVKFYGLFFAPYLFFHLKGKDRGLFAASYVGTVVLCYLPYLTGDGGFSTGSLWTYLQDWQFNASVYFVLQYTLGSGWARPAVAVLFASWALFLLSRKRELFRTLHDLFGGYMILTTTLFPWYFVWMFPLMLRFRSAAFFYLSGALLLSYHVHIGFYKTGTWTPIVWLGILSYLPFYALLIHEWAESLKRERHA